MVALFNPRDAHHDWAMAQIQHVPSPLLTCEAILAEASFLLQRQDISKARQIFVYFKTGALQIAFSVSEEYLAVQSLMEKYADVPMSLADA